MRLSHANAFDSAFSWWSSIGGIARRILANGERTRYRTVSDLVDHRKRELESGLESLACIIIAEASAELLVIVRVEKKITVYQPQTLKHPL